MNPVSTLTINGLPYLVVTPEVTDEQLARVHAELPSGTVRYLRPAGYKPRPQLRGRKFLKLRYSLTDLGREWRGER